MKYTRSVTIAPFVSEDVYGKRTYGTEAVVPACIDYVQRNIKDFRGNDFITSGWIALPPTTTITYNSKITMPDGNTPYIGSIAEAFDEEAGAVVYKEVYVGRVRPGEGTL